MKKIICLLLAMLLLCSAALAEPRYPEKLGEVTDAAAVLSQSTVKDLVTFADRVDDDTSIDFYVATVDFLDGESLADYAAGLRDKWNLHGDDLLLLIAVGEDKFGTFGGEDINRKISTQVQEKLLNTCFAPAFLEQRYDEAICQYIPALTEEINKAYDESISLNGLFGQTAPSQSIEEWAEEWSKRWADANVKVHTDVKVKTGLERVTHEDKDTGFSLGKVILTVFLLMVIFGKKDRRGGCGCGCAPFSRILAALGLWKLWDKN